MKLKTLFKTKLNWTQGAYAKDKAGLIVDAGSRHAVSFCITGGIIRCYETYEKQTRIREKIEKAIHSGLITWNDDETRKFADIKKVVTKLNI